MGSRRIRGVRLTREDRLVLASFSIAMRGEKQRDCCVLDTRTSEIGAGGRMAGTHDERELY